MNPKQRKVYFAMWADACRANCWDPKNNGIRRAEVLECMALVRGPRATTSDDAFGPDEVTALFCYLDFLAHPDDLERSARWVDCQRDYRAYNRARQADWHERETYGAAGAKKLRRDRFAGRQTASGEPLDEFDPEEIRRRHLTMASRHQRKMRQERASALEAGQSPEPEPEYVTIEGQPF